MVLLTLGLASLLGLPGASAAQTLVFHSPSDDGTPAGGSPTVPEGGIRSVFLYIDGGAVASAPGTSCDTGAGNEVCGFDLRLTGLSGMALSGFTADPSANLVTNLSAGTLRINGLDTQAPTPGSHRIGELLVNAVAGGSLELTSGEVIGADLGSEALTAQTIVSVPEPAAAGLLFCGSAMLALLERRRAGR